MLFAHNSKTLQYLEKKGSVAAVSSEPILGHGPDELDGVVFRRVLGQGNELDVVILEVPVEEREAVMRAVNPRIVDHENIADPEDPCLHCIDQCEEPRPLCVEALVE